MKKEIYVVMSGSDYGLSSYPIAAYSDRETAQNAAKWLGEDVEAVPFDKFSDWIRDGLRPYEIQRDSGGINAHWITELTRADTLSTYGLAIVWARSEDAAVQAFLLDEKKSKS